jgi:hypothetical protein
MYADDDLEFGFWFEADQIQGGKRLGYDVIAYDETGSPFKGTVQGLKVDESTGEVAEVLVLIGA